MKTIIVDDELPAIHILSQFIQKIPFLELQLATTDAFKALDELNKQSTDLLLSDIEMPDLTGIELINSLKTKPLIIFTTAYEEFALKGYELDIVDYLMKPIRFERFLKAVNKAQYLHNLENKNTTENTFLYLKVNYKTVKVAFDDILYIEGLKDYVKVYTKQKMYLTRLNLKGIASKLPTSHFIRIHRSYIVAFSKITSVQKNQIFIGKQTLPLGNS